MASFTADLLDRPAAPAAGAIALAFLDEAAAAAKRLETRTDHDALHDLRVAIRRLRATVRAYPGLHESVSKRQRRRLRKLARATNAARDAEVQIAWFNEHSRRFTIAQQAALAPLRARLRTQRRVELGRTRDKVERWFGKLERKLRRRFDALHSKSGARDAPFRAVAAATLVAHATELGSRFGAALPDRDPGEVHAARIAAKRLRYLLEPISGGAADVEQMVTHLKNLQDLLGAITDAHELERVLENESDRAAAAAGVLREDVEVVASKLGAEWLTIGPALQKQIDALARRLQPAPSTPPSLRRGTRRRSRRPAAV